MVGFPSIGTFKSAVDVNGQIGEINFAKSVVNANNVGPGSGVDLLQATGIPLAMPLATQSNPGVAVALGNWTPGALPINGNISPSLRYLIDIQISSALLTGVVMLADFLLLYPALNINATPTTLDNTVTLPRYTDGLGVQCIMTTTTLQATTAPTLTYTYVDSASNTTTATMTAFAAANQLSQLWVGGSNSGAINPIFLPMGNTGSGVKSLTSYTIASGTATGTACALLCKPIAFMNLASTVMALERDTILNFPSAPQILDGACLGLVFIQGPTVGNTTKYQGRIRYGWS